VPITTAEDLRDHVALATSVELSTIPPYLYAMYSIRDQKSAPARLLASIAVEEMLHVCLTTNLLLSLGGEPDFASLRSPGYPHFLAHHRPELPLELKACSHDHVRGMFMAIERPRHAHDAPEDDDFETLGQFYASIEQALDRLAADGDLFAHPQRERQLSNPSFYGPVDFNASDSGGLMLVDDLASARSALEIVIHQGEGVAHHRWADAQHLELTHFAKLTQLATASIGPTWPVPDNPRTAAFPPDVQVVSRLFNAIYRLTLLTLDDLFSGIDQSVGIGRLYALMEGGLARTARHLVTLPTGSGGTAGPTFEHYEFGDDPWGEVLALAQQTESAHPSLSGVATALTR